MNRRGFVGWLGAGAMAALRPGGFGPVGAPRELRFVERRSWAMGQPVHVQLFAGSEDQGYEAAAAALAELRRIEARLTLFDDASDLAELNRRAGRRSLRGDEDLTRVLAEAERRRRVSRGAFNVAVEPLMRAWGFRALRAEPPGAAELAEAREAVRTAVVRVDGDTVTLPSAHTRIDLGGIAVGYGLDRAGAVLRSHGVARALLDVSGDLLALGPPPGERGWLVGVADPVVAGSALREVRLAHRALATSANTANVVHYGKLVRGHVMDPASGYPADAVVQATAVARTGIAADASSTAMLVSGRRERDVEWSYFVGRR